MVDAVACGAVDDWVVGDVLAVVDHDGPDLDEGEEQHVRPLLKGEDEREDMVRQRLGKAVHGVEGDGGEGCRHDPFVVGLVHVLVDPGMVQATMNVVDAAVGEHEEERELEVVVPEARPVGGGVIHLGVSAHLEPEAGRGEERHSWNGGERLANLQRDLVLQVSGVLERIMVENEIIRSRRENEVEQGAENAAQLL